MSRSRSGKALNAAAVDESRRSFFLKMGAGASAALASTAAVAGPGHANAGDASLQVALLKEENTLRKLHQDFEQAMDDARYDEVIDMFADDAQVVFNGGVFANRSQGVSRLYRQHFLPGRSGKRMESAPGFALEADRQPDSVEVSADRLSARAVFPYSIQVGRPVESGTSLADMARLHGAGVRRWWEAGIYHVSYARGDTADGDWKIGRLEYETLARADYRPGRSYAGPIDVSPFSTRYPEDPLGPDALV